MSATEEELSTIQAQISQMQVKQARAQVVKENAQKALAEARTTLKEDFEVTTNEEAKELLTKLSEDLTTALATVRESLAKAGAA